jgi:hypothetical protein
VWHDSLVDSVNNSYFSGDTESDIRYRIATGIASASDAEWLAKLLDITRAELALVRADNVALRSQQPYPPNHAWPAAPYGWPQIWCGANQTL